MTMNMGANGNGADMPSTKWGSKQGSLQFSQLPILSVIGGVTLAPPPIVTALTGSGDLGIGFNGAVSMSTSGGNPDLNGTTVVLAVAGLATFINLNLTGLGTTNLVASAPSRASAVSPQITVIL